MSLSDRFGAMPDYAFPRLRALLGETPPGKPPIDLSIGEPKHAPPEFLRAILDAGFPDYRRYPPNHDPEDWHAAVAGWIARRYGVAAERFARDLALQPLSGTREGLFMATLSATPSRKAGGAPAVLMPNPFYPCYSAAALAAGAEPVYLSADARTGDLPTLDLPAELLERTAVFFVCSPANPQGACASMAYWRELLTLAERHDFVVFADECYSEIYRGAPPAGALEALAAMGGDPERLVAFHSLSKRSSLAGLRSGFAAGGAARIRALRLLRSYGGAPSPIPVLTAAAAAWSDEAHVEENRKLYDQKFAIADRLFTNHPSYRSPEAGFFLWLSVEDGEAAALELWRTEGVKALPGAYLSRRDAAGYDPGARRIRLALVDPADRIEDGLSRIVAAAERILDG